MKSTTKKVGKRKTLENSMQRFSDLQSVLGYVHKERRLDFIKGKRKP